jgi:hypothetical protein
LTLQRYQEKQAKGEPFDHTTITSNYSTRGTGRTTQFYESPQDSESSEDDLSDCSVKASSRRRGTNAEDDDDDEWVLDTPRKYIKKADRDRVERKVPNANYVGDVKKQMQQEKETKVIVKTTETAPGQIRKNIIFYNPIENQNPVQNTFLNVNCGNNSEKSPEKALIASKLKIKAAQKIGVNEDQLKHNKLQVMLILHQFK